MTVETDSATPPVYRVVLAQLQEAAVRRRQAERVLARERHAVETAGRSGNGSCSEHSWIRH